MTIFSFETESYSAFKPSKKQLNEDFKKSNYNFIFFLSYDEENVVVVRKGRNGYPSEKSNNQTGIDTAKKEDKYKFIPGILFPVSLCILFSICTLVCFRPGTCHFKAWIK